MLRAQSAAHSACAILVHGQRWGWLWARLPFLGLGPALDGVRLSQDELDVLLLALLGSDAPLQRGTGLHPGQGRTLPTCLSLGWTSRPLPGSAILGKVAMIGGPGRFPGPPAGRGQKSCDRPAEGAAPVHHLSIRPNGLLVLHGGQHCCYPAWLGAVRARRGVALRGPTGGAAPAPNGGQLEHGGNALHTASTACVHAASQVTGPSALCPDPQLAILSPSSFGLRIRC